MLNLSDTNNFATKACYAILDGEEKNVDKIKNKRIIH